MARRTMPQSEAFLWLQEAVAATDEPVLSDSAVERLLREHATADAYGAEPFSDGWEPTWDLDAAAAAGWQLKAGRVASQHDFNADGVNANRSQMYEHCVTMAERYLERVYGTG